VATDDLETYRVWSRERGTVEITGCLIGEISTRYGSPGQNRATQRDRWTDSRVFKLERGTYVVVKEAYSLVYHRVGTWCRIHHDALPGDECTAAVMDTELKRLHIDPMDAVPCPKCYPSDDLAGTDKIRFEFVRLWVDQCETGAQVRDALQITREREGRTTTFVPVPARALIEQCVRADPAFLAEAVVKIS